MESGWDSPWVGESVDDEPKGNVDDLLDSLGLNSGETPPIEPLAVEDHGASSRSRRGWVPLVALLGLGLVVVAGAMVWLLGSGSEGNDAALETVTTGDETVVDVDAEAEKLMGILSGLSLNEVTVEVRDARIYLTGSVPSEQDLTTVRNAIIASSDPALININEIEVGGPAYQQAAPAPGAAPVGPPPAGQAGQLPPPPGGQPAGSPPPGFVPPTPEQQTALQEELNRVLTDTPLVFDVGSTDLNQVQLKVLDTTVIGLLEGHPGVPVRLVGYTDEQGDENTNALLSFARAEAVRDYLISSGVPEFILRVEGRGEENASGDSGADRRVEIEVIRTP